MAAAASDFQQFISNARERKRNEALADRIFFRGRRQSAPSKLKPGTSSRGASLASRVGVKKPGSALPHLAASRGSRRSSVPAGDVDGDWTHDLHHSPSSRHAALGARVSLAGSKPAAAQHNAAATAAHRTSRLAAAVDRMDMDHVNVVGASQPGGGVGITIRGLAGPFTVMGQNFAPGTTAADIESAMTPVGGQMVSCQVVKTQPFLIAEMVFASREGGERVIDTFNDKTADGRLLKVYPKVGGGQFSASAVSPLANAPSGPRAVRAVPRDQLIDGSMGFSGDLMDTDKDSSNSSRQPLYSDKIVARNRWGRGFQRGRGSSR